MCGRVVSFEKFRSCALLSLTCSCRRVKQTTVSLSFFAHFCCIRSLPQPAQWLPHSTPLINFAENASVCQMSTCASSMKTLLGTMPGLHLHTVKSFTYSDLPTETNPKMDTKIIPYSFQILSTFFYAVPFNHSHVRSYAVEVFIFIGYMRLNKAQCRFLRHVTCLRALNARAVA